MELATITGDQYSMLEDLRRYANGIRADIMTSFELSLCDELLAMDLAHEILHYGEHRYVAGHPNPSCGSLVPGVRH